MKFIFHTLGMPFDGNTINEGKSLGGSESAAYYIAKEIASRGHEVIHFTNNTLEKPEKVDGVLYIPVGNAHEQAPLGENFMKFAKTVPHDVLVIQRSPIAFREKFNSKVNILWTHDLALKRYKGGFDMMSWNVDKILTVSEFHKKQTHEVYEFELDSIGVLRNAIDHKLFSNKIDKEQKFNDKIMVYSSRPERGLENLVKPGGIMDKLWDIDQSIKLVVCGYDNTNPEMKPYYERLWYCCEQLPNVQNVGPLSKKDLADLMSKAWLHVYPTEFEETSCITMMEEQASGTPVICTDEGALIETLTNGGRIVIPNSSNGVNQTGFISRITEISKDYAAWEDLHKKSLEKSKQYDWKTSADDLERYVDEIFEKKTSNKQTVLNHLLRNSDILAARAFCDKHGLVEEKKKIDEKYKEFFSTDLKEYYEGTQQKHIDDGGERSLGNHQAQAQIQRNNVVMSLLSKLPDGSTVMDYGCCIGHATFAFAHYFPKLNFIGADISELNVKIANKYKEENKVENIRFINHNGNKDSFDFPEVDAFICSEVLEHIVDPIDFIVKIEDGLKEGTKITFTTPYGPWEENGRENGAQVEHLSHFEEEDIREMFKHKKNFSVFYTHSFENKIGESFGHYIYTYSSDKDKPVNPINFDRKFKQQAPKEMVSLCMISKGDSETLGHALSSAKLYADQIVVGIDSDVFPCPASEAVERHGGEWFAIISPLRQGFAEARNKTLEKAKGEWIVWMDADEFSVHNHKIYKYFRNNIVNAYAVSQHHFSCEPVGLLKTDNPCRIFRNTGDFKFFGYVHEHPGPNKQDSINPVHLLNPNEYGHSHNGYDTENTRRERFMRNYALMEKNIKEKEIRPIDHMLWVRDQVQMNRYEYEQTGQISQQMIDRSHEALKYFKDLIKTDNVRLALESVVYTSEAVNTITGGKGFEIAFSIGANNNGIGEDLTNPPEPMKAKFLTEKDAKEFLDYIYQHKTQNLGGKYL